MQLHYVLYETPGLHQGERSPCHPDDGGVLAGTNHGDVDRTKPGNYREEDIWFNLAQFGTGEAIPPPPLLQKWLAYRRCICKPYLLLPV